MFVVIQSAEIVNKAFTLCRHSHAKNRSFGIKRGRERPFFGSQVILNGPPAVKVKNDQIAD
jgi:hypothetical protein